MQFDSVILGIRCPGTGVEFAEEGLAACTSIHIVNAAV
jgi:hypothetical protein